MAAMERESHSVQKLVEGQAAGMHCKRERKASQMVHH